MDAHISDNTESGQETENTESFHDERRIPKSKDEDNNNGDAEEDLSKNTIVQSKRAKNQINGNINGNIGASEDVEEDDSSTSSDENDNGENRCTENHCGEEKKEMDDDEEHLNNVDNKRDESFNKQDNSLDESLETDEEEILKNTKFVENVDPKRRPSRSRRSGVVNDSHFIERMLSTSSNNSLEDLTSVEIEDVGQIEGTDDAIKSDEDDKNDDKINESYSHCEIDANDDDDDKQAHFFIGSNTPSPTKTPDLKITNLEFQQESDKEPDTPNSDDIYYEEGPKRLKRQVLVPEDFTGAKTYQDKNKLIVKYPNRKVSFEHSIINFPGHDDQKASPLTIDVDSASPRTILKSPKRRASYESHMYRHIHPTGHINYGYLHDEFLDKLEKRKISMEQQHIYNQELEMYDENGYGSEKTIDSPMSDSERNILFKRDSDIEKGILVKRDSDVERGILVKRENRNSSEETSFQNGGCKRNSSSDSFMSERRNGSKRGSLIDDKDVKNFSAHLRKDSIALTSEKLHQLENIHRHYNQYDFNEREPFWKNKLSNWKKYQLHICVLSIFMSLVTIVVIGWHFHNRTNKMEKIGNRIFYDPETREMYLSNPGDTHRLYGSIGQNVPTWQLPFHCHSGEEKSKYTCLRWKNDAILRISYFEETGVNCYNISWEQIRLDLIPHDCFDTGDDKWFGPSNHSTPSWPLDSEQFTFSAANSRHFDAGTFSSAIDYHWISSAGSAIYVPNDVPLEVDWNDKEKRICLIAKYEGDFYGGHTTDFAKLNYTICSGTDAVTTFKYTRKLMEKYPKRLPTKSVMEKPVWSYVMDNKTRDEDLTSIIHEIKNNTFDCGLFEVAGHWQNKFGDLQFGEQVKNISNIVDLVTGNDCSMSVEINPYFDIMSSNFREGLKKGYYLKDSKNLAPGMVRFEHEINAMLDVTNKEASQWMKKKLKKLREHNKIEGFSVVYGKPYWVPYNPGFLPTEVNPSTLREKYTEMFFSIVSSSRSDIIEGTSHTQDIPLLIPIPSYLEQKKDQTCIVGAIERTLTLGIKGYPFVISDFHKEGKDLPSEEIYTRWMQLSTFLTAIRFSIMPWEYGQHTVEVARNLTKLHKSYVTPVIIALLSDVLAGLPIIRPIWWTHPDDEIAFKISDEFLVGDSILVAPVLCEHTTERKIYFPEGMWSDKSNGNLIQGKSWITYPVNIDTIPYFQRVKVLTETESK